MLSPAAPVRHEEREMSAAPEQQATREIPRSQFGRIRTLVTYGMTVAEVAKVYGVVAAAIARILRQASPPFGFAIPRRGLVRHNPQPEGWQSTRSDATEVDPQTPKPTVQ
jgi:hypothetical protein